MENPVRKLTFLNIHLEILSPSSTPRPLSTHMYEKKIKNFIHASSLMKFDIEPHQISVNKKLITKINIFKIIDKGTGNPSTSSTPPFSQIGKSSTNLCYEFDSISYSHQNSLKTYIYIALKLTFSNIHSSPLPPSIPNLKIFTYAPILIAYLWYPDKIPSEKSPEIISLNAVEREPVETRVLNPNASEASYKPKQLATEKRS